MEDCMKYMIGAWQNITTFLADLICYLHLFPCFEAKNYNPWLFVKKKTITHDYVTIDP
jgi:hypothetical protein